MSFEFWDIVLSPRFLIPFTIVAGGFVPMLFSIRKTYLDSKTTDEPTQPHE